MKNSSAYKIQTPGNYSEESIQHVTEVMVQIMSLFRSIANILRNNGILHMATCIFTTVCETTQYHKPIEM